MSGLAMSNSMLMSTNTEFWPATKPPASMMAFSKIASTSALDFAVMPLPAESPSMIVRVVALPTWASSIQAVRTMVSLDSSIESMTGVTIRVVMPIFSPSAITTIIISADMML